MTIVRQILSSVHSAFPETQNGRKRAAWFILALLAILLPFASSRTSELLLCLKWLFGLSVPQRSFYNFMASATLPWARICSALWRLIPCPFTDGRLLLALDDYINPKTGENIFGCHRFFDHAAKANQSSYPWSQNVVTVGLLKVVKHRWTCIPLLARFYHLKKDLLKPEPIMIGRKKVVFRSKLEHAVDLIVELAAAFRDAPVLVVCDSWFGNNGLLRPLRNALGTRCHLLTRLRSNAAIFDTTPPCSGKRGRPRKYGDRLGTTESLAHKLRDLARSYSIELYGKRRDVVASTQLVMLKSLKCRVRIVWVYRKTKWVALSTTDLNLSVEQIVEFYGARWKIEAAFKELKRDLGSTDTQTRCPHAVMNHLNFCMTAMIVTWIYVDLDHETPQRRHAVAGRRRFAFSDARRAFLRAATTENYDWLSADLVKWPKNSTVVRLLRLVA